jgi:hypothetical protein
LDNQADVKVMAFKDLPATLEFKGVQSLAQLSSLYIWQDCEKIQTIQVYKVKKVVARLFLVDNN